MIDEWWRSNLDFHQIHLFIKKKFKCFFLDLETKNTINPTPGQPSSTLSPSPSLYSSQHPLNHHHLHHNTHDFKPPKHSKSISATTNTNRAPIESNETQKSKSNREVVTKNSVTINNSNRTQKL